MDQQPEHIHVRIRRTGIDGLTTKQVNYTSAQTTGPSVVRIQPIVNFVAHLFRVHPTLQASLSRFRYELPIFGTACVYNTLSIYCKLVIVNLVQAVVCGLSFSSVHYQRQVI